MKQFDHEKLEVYRLSIRFIAWTSDVVCSIKEQRDVVLLAEVLNQLDRASISIALNIAEGNGRRQMKQRIRFLNDARGSATECAACLDILVAKKILESEDIVEAKDMLVSVVSMLSKLVQYFEDKFAIGKDPGNYGKSDFEISVLSEDEEE